MGSQFPPQWQSSVHGKFARLHRQLRARLQGCLQPHLTRSNNESWVIGTVVQTGSQYVLLLWLAFLQPHSSGFGTSCNLCKQLPQISPPWYATRRQCCCKAFRVGGIASICLPFLVNNLLRDELKYENPTIVSREEHSFDRESSPTTFINFTNFASAIVHRNHKFFNYWKAFFDFPSS